MNKYDELLIQYLHGEISDADKAIFEKELETNTELQKELEELQNVDAFLSESLPIDFEESLPPQSHAKILETARKKTEKSRSLWFYISRAAVVSAACYAVVFSWFLPEKESTFSLNSKAKLNKMTEYNLELKDAPVAEYEELEILEEAVEDFIAMPTVEMDVKEQSSLTAPPPPSPAPPIGVGLTGTVGKDMEPSSKFAGNIQREFKSAPAKLKLYKKLKQEKYDDDLFFLQESDKQIQTMIENSNEAYDHFVENDFINVSDEALSTFSIDVDTASYSNVRRFLNRGQMPPKGSIRIEEMINYFKYDYDTPKGEAPFAVNLALSKCPWNEKAKLVRIGLKGQEIERSERPKANLVFLLDVSGSMNSQNKLPFLKKSMKLLLNNLNEEDKVAIVVYAGASGLVLPSTACSERGTIMSALDRLSAGGSTNGGAGIDLAYRTAIGNFIEDGINRVILCTDGDFNVGNTSHSGLVEQIQKNAKTGVFLSVLGFGMGNYKDSRLEKLANKGNGIYGYIDNYDEAKKLFVDQINGSLLTIAKDVKIQVEFNPQQVASYRLVGYENRKLNKQDFNDDKKDAGEIGSGHTVTALYELIPVGSEVVAPKVDELKYQPKSQESDKFIGEIMNVKVRYKKPDEDKSKLLQFPLKGDLKAVGKVSEEMKLATSVATFGMILRDSKYKGTADYDMVLKLAEGFSRAEEKEFVELVNKAKRLSIMNK